MKKTILAIAVAMAVTGCASGGMNMRPQDITALEQKAAAQPNNADVTTALGIAYYNAKRYDDAVKTLARVDATSKAAGAASLYLGLANEEVKDWNAARTAYESYLSNGTSAEVKDKIRARLSLVARQQLKTDAKATLAREQQLSEEAPTPRTIAVMPFRMVGTNEDLAPLQTALTDMIITDLSVSPALTAVERVKVNAMIDEMLLAQSGLAEAGTGARVGHLLKAENVVQGVVAQSGEKDLRLDATVLKTATRASAGSFGQNQSIDQIFDLEKQAVFGIFQSLGVTLTAAERDKINENRTGNLLAFLAYGRGLSELDRGNFQQASTYFRQATQLDPGFQRAAVTSSEATQLQQASQQSTGDIAQAANVEAPAAVAQAVTPPTTAVAELLQNTLNDIAPTPATQTTQQSSAPQNNNTAANQASNQSSNVTNSQGQNSTPSASAKATVVIRICNITKGPCS